MLIPVDGLREQYEHIKSAAAATGGCTVLLLVAADSDSLCAARMLTTLLKADSVEFKLVPVAGYTDVQKEIVSVDGDAGASEPLPLRSIIMINCGAVPKIDELVVFPAGTTIYVIDAHLPVYHSNVRSASQIRVFCLADVPLALVPEDGDSDLEDDDEEDGEDGKGIGGEEQEDEEDSEGVSDSASSVEDGDEEEEGENEEEDAGAEEAAGGAGAAAARAVSDTIDGSGAADAADDGKDGVGRQLTGSKRARAASGNEGEEGEGGSGAAAAEEGLESGASAHSAAVGASKPAASARQERRKLRKAGGDSSRGRGKGRGGPSLKRARRGGGARGDGGDDDEDADAGDDEDEDEEEGSGGGPGRGHQAKLDGMVAELRRRRRARYNSYYAGGHTFGAPAAFVIFRLCQQLSRLRNDLLWLAIVGATDHFLSERAGGASYAAMHEELRAAVTHLNTEEAHPMRGLAAAAAAGGMDEAGGMGCVRVGLGPWFPSTAAAPLSSASRGLRPWAFSF